MQRSDAKHHVFITALCVPKQSSKAAPRFSARPGPGPPSGSRAYLFSSPEILQSHALTAVVLQVVPSGDLGGQQGSLAQEGLSWASRE